MTKAAYNNSLYSFLRSRFSNALALEYGIRASNEISEEAMEGLREWDRQLRVWWHVAGASDAEIEDSNLLDYSWDLIQFKRSFSRRHGKVVHKDINRMMGEASSKLPDLFKDRRHLLAIPAARFFRIADLLRGSDVGDLLQTFRKKLAFAKPLEKDFDVRLEHFVGINVREPVRLHPAFHIFDTTKNGRAAVGIAVELDGDFDVANWEHSLKEFQYHYAVLRQQLMGLNDDGRITGELAHDFLQWEHAGERAEFQISNFKQIERSLIGLQVWDDCKLRKMKVVDAIDAASSRYYSSEDSATVDRGQSNVQGMYKEASKNIRTLERRFLEADARYGTLTGRDVDVAGAL